MFDICLFLGSRLQVPSSIYPWYGSWSGSSSGPCGWRFTLCCCLHTHSCSIQYSTQYNTVHTHVCVCVHVCMYVVCMCAHARMCVFCQGNQIPGCRNCQIGHRTAEPLDSVFRSCMFAVLWVGCGCDWERAEERG